MVKQLGLVMDVSTCVGCNHCRKPACAAVCPANAISRSGDGVVVIDEGACIGCEQCVFACPYGNVQLDERNIAVKCQLCRHLIDQGKEPGCVSACKAKMHQWAAIHFGDLGDPGSKVFKMVEEGCGEVLNPEYGTEPQHYYLNLPNAPIAPRVEQVMPAGIPKTSYVEGTADQKNASIKTWNESELCRKCDKRVPK